MSPEQLCDILDCGTPEDNWRAIIAHFQNRASLSRTIADDLEREAADATEQAAEFREAAALFDVMVHALGEMSIGNSPPSLQRETNNAG